MHYYHMKVAENTQETTQKSAHTHTETHTSKLLVAAMRVGSDALLLTQCFLAAVHVKRLH